MRALLMATVITAMLTGGGAIAQQSTQPMMGQQIPGTMMYQGWTGPMMGQGWMGYGMMDPSQHVEGRLAFLKTELKITDAQAPEWNAYAEAMRTNSERMGELMRQMMSNGMVGQGVWTGQGMMNNQGMMAQGQSRMMSLPDRLDWVEQHMAALMEMLEAIKEPTVQLYTVLSDEQKRIADQLMSPMGMIGMM
jgi:LTXXQ motif family protein